MEMENRSNRRFLFGVVLIVFGSLWILERLRILPESLSDLIISWQTLLIVIGVVSLINGNETTGWVLILIGGLFMVPHVFEIPYKQTIERIAPVINTVASHLPKLAQSPIQSTIRFEMIAPGIAEETLLSLYQTLGSIKDNCFNFYDAHRHQL